jgi:glycosyltransferase involved in cell wall biosynthesis
MRVLHLYAGNLYGGVETYLVTLARCPHLLHEVEHHFALCFRGRLWDELSAAGATVHDLGHVRLRYPWTVLAARSRLASLLGPAKYSTVVCHMPWTLGLLGGSVGKRTRLVAHFHNPPGSGWTEWLAARRRPERLIVPSKHAADGYRRKYPDVPVEVLNYPLPPQVAGRTPLSPDGRSTIRQDLGAAPDDVVILQASRIEPWKGPDLTLRALTHLRDLPRWRFWLAGGIQRPHEQHLFNELRQIADMGGIADRVALLGQRSDVATLMQAADLYCQGNRGAEGFSLAYLEASFSGLPIVTTDLGGAGEMIDSSTGILVPASEDVTGLANALRRLITAPDLRAEMGRRARDKAIRLCETGQQLRRLSCWLTSAPDGL